MRRDNVFRSVGQNGEEAMDHMKKRHLIRNAAAVCAGLSVTLVAGCGGQMKFPVTESGQQSLVDRNINIIAVSTDNIYRFRDAPWVSPHGGRGSNPPPDPGVYSYRVGAGDQLRVLSWTTPERTQEGSDLMPVEGPVVDERGQFFYPFVGNVRAQGRTVTEIRDDLTERLRQYIADPQVEVAVQQFSAHKATITGEIGQPGPTVLTNVPMRLLDLVNSAGITPDSDLRQVVIRRRGAEYRVNLRAFMERGEHGQNPILLPGDLVYVPPLADNKVFTFGEIGVGEMPLGPEKMSLTEVLAAKGGIDRIRADARGVFVFRRTKVSPDGFDVYQFDLREASTLMLASEFAMAPLDIVFVTNDPITRWNDTVGKVISPVAGIAYARSVTDKVTD